MDWLASPQVPHRTPLAHRPFGPAHILPTPGAFGWKPLCAFHTTHSENPIISDAINGKYLRDIEL